MEGKKTHAVQRKAAGGSPPAYLPRRLTSPRSSNHVRARGSRLAEHLRIPCHKAAQQPLEPIVKLTSATFPFGRVCCPTTQRVLNNVRRGAGLLKGESWSLERRGRGARWRTTVLLEQPLDGLLLLRGNARQGCMATFDKKHKEAWLLSTKNTRMHGYFR